jgi:hypothetical protein
MFPVVPNDRDWLERTPFTFPVKIIIVLKLLCPGLSPIEVHPGMGDSEVNRDRLVQTLTFLETFLRVFCNVVRKQKPNSSPDGLYTIQEVFVKVSDLIGCQKMHPSPDLGRRQWTVRKYLLSKGKSISIGSILVHHKLPVCESIFLKTIAARNNKRNLGLIIKDVPRLFGIQKATARITYSCVPWASVPAMYWH